MQISPFGNFQWLDTNGDPASGWQLFVYLGRTTTKAAVYTDPNGVGSHENPITLNANGFAPSPIYIDPALAYKFILALPDDNDPPTEPFYTADMVTVGTQLPTSATPEWVTGTTPTYVGTTQFTVAGNQTNTYTVGRRVKAIINSGAIYGTITASSFSTNTTVTVAWDSTTLDSSVSVVYYGFLAASGSSWPGGFNNGLITQLNGGLVVPVTSPFNLLPVGTISWFAGTVAPPAGYLSCNGTNISRTNFAALFGAIGTVFGSGDGSTTFGLPNISALASGVSAIIRYA